MEENIYTQSQGEVIFFLSKMCDEFEKYINDVHKYKWDKAKANWLFNVYMNRKIKEVRGWHMNVVEYLRVSANVNYYPDTEKIKRRLLLYVDIDFREQEDNCLITPSYTYE